MGGWMDRLMQPEVLRAVQQLKPIAEEAGLTLPQFALAWVLREPNVASAIIGASRPEQVRENAAASGVVIDTQLFLRAEQIIDEALGRGRDRLDRLRAAARRRDEDLLDRQLEQLGDPEGERQRRIVFAGLDRIDALARHFEALGEVLLAPGCARRGAREGGFPSAARRCAERQLVDDARRCPSPTNQTIATE